MKVLFGMSQKQTNEIEDSILNYYQQTYGEEFEYEREYDNMSIVSALGDQHYDVLILNENLEKSESIGIGLLDRITDKSPDLNIIFILDEAHKNTEFIKQLYSTGIYNVLFKEDLLISNIVNLIKNPRTKLEFKQYVDIEIDETIMVSAAESIEKEETLDEIKAKQIITELSQVDDSRIGKEFDKLCHKKSNEEVKFILSILDDNLLDRLYNSNSKYFKKLTQAEDSAVKIKEVVISEVQEVQIIQTPSDYRQRACFVGNDNTGTSSIIAILGQYFSEKKIKCAIIDYSLNKDSFDIYSEYINQRVNDYREYKINSYLSIYTGLDTAANLEHIIAKNSEKHNVFLIDTSTSTLDLSSTHFIDKFYLLNDMDISEVRNCTAYQLQMKNNEIPVNKIRYIINKVIPTSISVKEIVACMKVFKDLDNSMVNVTNEIIKYFEVPYELSIIKMKYECKYNLKNLDAEFMEKIKQIANDIYQHTGEKKKTNFISSMFGKIKKG